jgi:endonuclease YncB( thermonuclease family)
MALLRVTGTIPIDQFWPNGESDADTSKVIVVAGSFEYKAPGKAFKATHVFDNAVMKGPVITKTERKLTIRLQGIDAPELHYQVSWPKAKEYSSPAQRVKFKAANSNKLRQNLAETATVKLGELLAPAAQAGQVKCTVTTEVEGPGDAFDMFGRFVGDIHVRVGNKNININRWLLEQGWAYPAIYNSMQPQEIRDVIAAAAKGRKKAQRVWQPNYSAMVGRIDWNLHYRKPSKKKKPVFVAADDRGKVVFPKLYRRLMEWEVKKKAGMTNANYVAFLATKKDDKCFLTAEFLQEPYAATERHFSTLLGAGSKFLRQPEDVVFKERSSKLKDANGKEITEW